MVKLKVKCYGADLCHNPDCMHYDEHIPVKTGEHTNCLNEKSVCPLTGTFTSCQVVTEYIVNNAAEKRLEVIRG